MMTPSEVTLADHDGWGWPMNSRKAHYFANSRALCGRWMYTGRRIGTAESESSEDDCRACTKKLAATLAKAKETP